MEYDKILVPEERPDWDQSFMFSALWTATRASCNYIQNGALVVKDKRVLASGYNGAPPGCANCLEIGCRKDYHGIDFNDKGKSTCRGNHAETNAMGQISREQIEGAKLYTVIFPCTSCAKEISQKELSEVVYLYEYEEPDSLTYELFKEKGIHIRKLDLDIDKCFDFIKHIRRK
jgi:dCMP deaminase